MNKKSIARKHALLPNGVPRYVRIYDNNGESFDRFTVVFTGRYRYKTSDAFWHLGMSANPFHPQGFGQHGESRQQIDRPRYRRLGRKIKWENLPANCQRCALDTYCDLWDINIQPELDLK